MILPRRSLAAAVLVLAGSVPWAGTASAQIDTDSLRQAQRAQAEATRRQVSAAAAVFTNRQLPAERRIAAVANIGAFDDDGDVERTTAIVFDRSEPAPVRARAVQLIGSRAALDEGLLARLLEVAAEPDQPIELRRATAGTLEGPFFAWHVGHHRHDQTGRRDQIMVLLRRLARDPDPAIRRPALRVLAALEDQEGLSLLEEGLRSPDAALVPPLEAVQLLGLVDPARHYPLLRQILDRPPDPDSRLAAIRLLAGDAPSRDRIARILHDPAEPLQARRAALAAIAAGDPQGFPQRVVPLLRDDDAPRDLRVQAIKTVEVHRTTRDRATLQARRADAFDRQVEQLAATSPDADVRAAAERYLTRTRSPH